MGKQPPRGGFNRRNKKAVNNLTIEDILGGVSEHVIASLSYHAALLGSCLMQSTNRARSAVKFTILLDEEREEKWVNTPEEANIVLCDLIDMLVDTCRERGYLAAPEPA